jgi:hypothetical protein
MIIKFPQIFSALGSKINKAMTLVMPANYMPDGACNSPGGATCF